MIDKRTVLIGRARVTWTAAASLVSSALCLTLDASADASHQALTSSTHSSLVYGGPPPMGRLELPAVADHDIRNVTPRRRLVRALDLKPTTIDMLPLVRQSPRQWTEPPLWDLSPGAPPAWHEPSRAGRGGSCGSTRRFVVLVTCCIDEVGMVVTFEEWYESARPRVLAALVVAFGDVDGAAEATDEAMARALADWDRVGVMDSPIGWAVRVAVNVARRRSRRRQLEAVVLRRTVPPGEVPAAAGEVWLMVRDLPRRQREVLVMTYMLGFRQDEVASALGVSRSAVSSALTDARRRLAASIDGDVPVARLEAL